MSISPDEIRAFLAPIEPFKRLPAADFEKVLGGARPKTFQKGETIYNEGEAADGVWVLYQGRIQILKFTSEGKAFAVETLSRGELFGVLCRLGANGRRYPCTAVAASAATAVRLMERAFLEAYQKSPGFISGLCSLCSDRLQDVQGLRCMGQETVPVRIAHMLSRLYLVHGKTVPFTKKEIAELSGTTVETTFRTLAQLEDKGVLESGRGQIVIKKPEVLQGGDE